MPITPATPPPFPQDFQPWAQVQQPPMPGAPLQQPSRQMIQAERASTTESAVRVGAPVRVTRRFRIRRLPCGHCSDPLPRFMALAPSVLCCPTCANQNQVMESWLFRRGYPLGDLNPSQMIGGR